ncbi:hypothetical protein [Salinisphaera sp. G21_0]|uniref:hypothetical protein n=1 Tax=Salinisphaera sp. G21_0 TaxID=2821094 RepID=UPI001ADB783F|nr:hypothetical protein [Salinisphaera sp. G21_0]MBO9480233.1 hypothetical protein [Salinisphaera sp. G21_0]
MNITTNTNNIDQPGSIGNTTAGLAHDGLAQEKKSAASLGGHVVSVHKSLPQLSSQESNGPEEHTGRSNFAIQMHAPQKKTINLNPEAWAAHLEKKYHPSVFIKFESDLVNHSVVGCMDFEKLLEVVIDIQATKEGSGSIGMHPGVSLNGKTDARIKVAVEKEKTIFTILDDYGCWSANLHIGNDYWEYNSFDILIDKYKKYKLISTEVKWQELKLQMEKDNFTTVYL